MSGQFSTRVSGVAVASRVASLYGLPLDQLRSKSVKRPLVRARDIAAYAVYNLCDHMSYAGTGRVLGGRDHSTIGAAVKRAEALLKIERHAKVWEEVQREFRQASLAQSVIILDGLISEAQERVRDLRRERAEVIKAQQVAA